MDTVRDIASSVSVSAVIIGAIYILCPDGKMGKQMSYVAGLLMLLAVITPFAGASFNTEELSHSVQFNVNAEDMMKNQVEYLAGSLLRGAGIEFKRIEPFMDISPSGDISIYRICVYGASEPQAAAELLRSNFPECEVTAEDE